MWAKYGVRVLGTPVASIVQSEDRKMFAEVVASVGERVAPSAAVYSVEEVRLNMEWAINLVVVESMVEL